MQSQENGYFIKLSPKRQATIRNLMSIHGFGTFQEYLDWLVEHDIERVKQRHTPLAQQLVTALKEEAMKWLPPLNESK